MPTPQTPRDTLQDALNCWHANERNASKAAAELGLARTTLQSRIEAARLAGLKPRVKVGMGTSAPGLIRAAPVNQRILCVSDLHAPFNHRDALPFLTALRDKYKPTRVVSLGDETDGHSLSFHSSDQDLHSAGTELQMAREVMWEMEKIFPCMDFVESNHGSLLYRKAKEHGIPRHLVVSYRDMIFGERDSAREMVRPGGRGDGWRWYPTLTLDLPSEAGEINIAFFVHGMSISTAANVRNVGTHFIQGHHHSTFECVTVGTPLGNRWGMTVGCLIDDHSLAFSYNKLTPKRPILGCGLIEDGWPRLLPMRTDPKHNRWTGFVP